jgi:hypothetical protein
MENPENPGNGEFLAFTGDNKVKGIHHDYSKRARFLRWIGALIHHKKLSQYGYDNSPVSGVAVSDSIYDEEEKCHFVTIEKLNYGTKTNDKARAGNCRH